MSRPVNTAFLCLCLLAQGCKTDSTSTFFESPRNDILPETEFVVPKDDTPLANWTREHPCMTCALAIGAAVGVAVLAGYLLYVDLQDGKGTPLPWIQAGQ
jgi:hypothetical protein